MIKQNIRISILSLCFLLGICLVVLAFIKIDVCTVSLINLSAENTTIAIENKEASYIENHEISRVKILYGKEFFTCPILFESQGEQYTNYLISVPEIIPKTIGYLSTNVIIDSINFYQYILKK